MKVIVASAKINNAIRIEDFTGSTFRELKQNSQFSSIYGDGSGVDVIINPGNVTLRGDDSTLPSTDFKVFIVPSKNKAGITDGDAVEVGKAIGKAIKEASRVASRQEAMSLKEVLVTRVNEFFQVEGTPVVDQELSDAELEAALLEARSI
jgi:hypothetical protein